ncbi:hypothetical protein HNY73_001679 [Argiope bruennichi]|uniref:Uncharacterized protein n=1 Tax=Argiope bruennichi TaxID=94029 RepID=A0A8T0FR36_ARGBR|nr:hypothetical protein HNY73_001679 [Argiope bruennichi]
MTRCGLDRLSVFIRRQDQSVARPHSSMADPSPISDTSFHHHRRWLLLFPIRLTRRVCGGGVRGHRFGLFSVGVAGIGFGSGAGEAE